MDQHKVIFYTTYDCQIDLPWRPDTFLLYVRRYPEGREFGATNHALPAIVRDARNRGFIPVVWMEYWR